MHKFVGCKYFTKFDLAKGYYQIQVEESDRSKSAFDTPFGKYEFNRIPLGLLIPPKCFHNIIARAIKGKTVFLDDIIVFSKTENEHYEIVIRY